MSVKQKIAAVGAVAATATAILVAATTPAHALSYTYVSVLDPPGQTATKVIDIRGYSTQDRGVATLYGLRTSGNVANQRWSIEYLYTLPNGHRVYQLRNQLSGKCLDKSEDVPDADGNAVYQYTCSGTSNQYWEQMGSSGWVQLKNVSDGRCLDITGPSFTDGAVLHVWHCYSTWSQYWNIDY
jgi:Ricin-type beta-trefoil lectin domain-like